MKPSKSYRILSAAAALFALLGCGGGLPEDRQGCGVLDEQGNVECGYKKPEGQSCPEGTRIVDIEEVSPCAVEL